MKNWLECTSFTVAELQKQVRLKKELQDVGKALLLVDGCTINVQRNAYKGTCKTFLMYENPNHAVPTELIERDIAKHGSVAPSDGRGSHTWPQYEKGTN